MGVLKFLLIAIVLAAAGYFGYNYYNQNMTPDYRTIEAPVEASQFVQNLRFTESRISYFINSNCEADRKSKMELALKIISDSAPAISFYSSDESSADILIGCSKDSYEQEKNVFAAGEGGPTSYLSSNYYPIIKRGKVLLYQKSDCQYPVVEIHELLHVFGFAHVNNKTNIMFPYAICTAKMDPVVSAMLQELYSKPSLPELLFANSSAVKSRSYLNFNVEISNQGLKPAKDIIMDVYADGTKLESMDVGNISLGETQHIKISNMLLPSSSVSTIEFTIIYSGEEFDKANNRVVLSV
jgi:hypothetical protein